MITTEQSRPAAPPPGWADPSPPRAPGDRWRRALPLLLWLGCLALAVALLVTLGHGRLAAPALTDPGSWRAWAAGRDPVEATMVVLRLLALGCAWYLTGVTSISVVARALRAVRLVRIADALSVGPIRHLAQQAVGISLAAGVLASVVPAPAATSRAAVGPRDVEVAVMVPVPALQPSARPTPPAEEVPVADEPAEEVSVADEPTADQTVADVPGEDETGEDETGEDLTAAAENNHVAPTMEVEPVADELRPVRIRPGDHFWALAEQAVADHLGRPGTEREVAAHWQAILDANADRLVAAGNPDLLVPGQLVVLPPVAEVPR